MKIKIVLFVLLLLKSLQIDAQFEVIETNSTATIYELHTFNNETIIIGSEFYMAKYDSNLDTLIQLNPPGPSNHFIHDFNRIDANTAFLVSGDPGVGTNQQFIYKTTDNCATWTLIYDTMDVSIEHLRMFDSLEGIFFTFNYRQYRTLDGGHTFQVENSPFLTTERVDRYDDSVICIGTLLQFKISYNRGRNWLPGNFVQALPTSFDMISTDSILATSTYFSKTFDGGLNWSNLYLGVFKPSKVKRLKDNTLFMVGGRTYYDSLSHEIKRGLILKSTDFGETWQTYDTGLITRFLNMEIINDSIALISGDNGVLIKYFYRDHNLGFEDLATTNFLSIFPNPFSNSTTIVFKSAFQNVDLVLYNVYGQKVKTISNFSGNKLKLERENLSNGIYYLNLESEGKMTETIKLIIAD